MDVNEIFDDIPHTRGELFYKLYQKIESIPNDELLSMYDNVLDSLSYEEKSFIKENELNIACYFEALADQYRLEEQYHEEVTEKAYEKFNEVTKSITIAGFD